MALDPHVCGEEETALCTKHLIRLTLYVVMVVVGDRNYSVGETTPPSLMFHVVVAVVVGGEGLILCS